MEIKPETEKGKLIQKARLESPEKTAEFAAEFAQTLRPGDTLTFYGNLGSGKTFFVQALCRYFQTEEEPTSPTFTIINEYRASEGFYIYHFDFYRLEHDAELANLGLEDYFYNEHLCLIEWADKIQAHLPERRYDIFLNFVEGQPDAREIVIYQADAT
jgi:tRNA threonylcarbamoyladenosine biosynthesis protein TsaE